MIAAVESVAHLAIMTVVDTANWLGQRPLVWALVGAIQPIIWLSCMRMNQILPEEDGWQVRLIRTFSGLTSWTLNNFIFLIALPMTAFAVWAVPLVSTEAFQEELIAFLKQWLSYSASGYVGGILIGVVFWILIARLFEPWLARVMHRQTIRTSDPSNELTDIRKMVGLPEKLAINHDLFFQRGKDKRSFFMGIDSHGKPVFIDDEILYKSHSQIAGPSGTGKGVQATVILCQCIMRGEAVYVADPKHDEWMSSVLAEFCEKNGKPFVYIDLTTDKAQFNLFKGINKSQLIELLITGFSLDRKGKSSDYYLSKDRAALRDLSAMIEQGDVCPSKLFDEAGDYVSESRREEANGFFSQLEELATVEAVNTLDGIDISAPLSDGGVIFVAGSMRQESVVNLQKMIVVRIFQMLENRSKGQDRHCFFLLDEFKYLSSASTNNGFGVVRDKRCSLLITHQSRQDLRDVKGLDAGAAAGAVEVNTQVKWFYRSKEPETAVWVSQQTGKILVEKERRTVYRNELNAEVSSGERQTDQVERYLFDENTVMSLPDSCAIFIDKDGARLALASPIPTSKRRFVISEAEPYPRKDLATEFSLSDQDPGDEFL